MPVEFQKNITPHLTVSVWDVSESIDELLNNLSLNEDEIEELGNINHPKGKKQWLAARNLIAQTLSVQQHVIYNDLGVPYLKGQTANISLSHSGNRVAFSCNTDQETGIDIQQYNQKIFNIAPKFMNEFELNWAKEHKDFKHYLHLLWNFKESIFKYYTTQMPFKSVQVQPFDFKNEGWAKAVRKLDREQEIFQMRYHTFDNYYLGYIVEKI